MKLTSLFAGVFSAFLMTCNAFAVPPEVPLKSSYSTDFTDIWWNPKESGWGLQMVQTDSFIYVTIYVYGPDGKPTWFGGGLNAGAPPTFTGKLFVTTGPYFDGPFNPAAVTVREAGTMTFTATTVSSGQFTYTIDGITVTKAIQRQPLTLDDFSGSYAAWVTETASGCNNPANNGTVTAPVAIDITQDGSSASVVTTNVSGGKCTYSGSYTQLGRMGELLGNYFCSDGQVGTMKLAEMNAVLRMFTARLQSHSTNFGCNFVGEIAGVVPR